MPTWIQLAGGGIAGVSGGSTPPAGPAAPNITSATAAATYGMWANDSVFGLAGTITLPTTDPEYAHLDSIQINARIVGTTGWAPVVTVPRASFGLTTVTYSSGSDIGSGEFEQTRAIAYWELQFLAVNELGSATASPVTVSVTVEASAVTSVAGTDTGTRTADPITRLVSTLITYVPVLNGGQVPQNVTSFFPLATDPTKYQGIGWDKMTVVGQTFSAVRLVPATDTAWSVYCATGALIGDPNHLYTAAELTALGAVGGSITGSGAGGTVAGLGLPSASCVTTAAIAAGAGGANPYDVTRADGSHFVRIPGVTWTDPTDPNASFTRITVQCVDASGAAAPADQGGTEVPFFGPNDPIGDTVSAGMARATNPLEFDYNPVGSTYTYMQYRFYVMNRNATSTADWSVSGKSVLETSAWSSAAYLRLSFGPAVLAAAPNITVSGTTAAAAYGMWANDSSFGFAGRIILPTTDPHYSYLAAVQVDAQLNGTTGWINVVTVPETSFGSSYVDYAGPVLEFPQTRASSSWTVRFTALNAAGSPTASPITVSVTVEASSVTGFTSAVEVGTRYIDPVNAATRLLSLTVEFIPILNGGQVPQNVTYLLSTDSGATYTWCGWARMDTVGQQIQFARLVPGPAQTWKIAACSGAVGSPSTAVTSANLATLYPGSVVSSGISISGLGLPAANSVTTAAIAAGAGGANPYDQMRPDGSHYVRIPGVTWTDTTDVNASFMRITVQCVDSGGSPAPSGQGGTEVPFYGPLDALGDVVSPGAARATDVLEFDYNPVGSTYTYMQYRFYYMSRNATNTADWNPSAGKSVLETTAWSGAAYLRLLFGPAILTNAAAPNVTATAVAAYGMNGNDSSFGFVGPNAITLPTSDPNYSHLASIQIDAQITGGTSWTPIVSVPRSSFGATYASYDGGTIQFPQGRTAVGWTLRFTCLNEYGAPTASPYTATVTVEASAVTAVAAADYPTNRVADPITRLLSTQINIAPTLNGNQVPQNVTFWLPLATDPTKYQGVGWNVMVGASQSFPFMRLVPATTTNWYAYCMTGAILGDPNRLYSASDLVGLGATASSAFSVGGLGLPSATCVTTATIAAGVSGPNPYDVTRADGSHFVRIPGVTWTDPTDVNASFTRITVQCTDASGTPAPSNMGGTEVVFYGPNDPIGDTVSAGMARSTDPLEFDYNTGTTYVYMQYRFYVMNRNATSTADWVPANGKSVLQTGAWSAAAYDRVLFGPLPSSATPAVVLTTNQTLTAATTISSPGTPSDGWIWKARIKQDGTGGWAVTWGTGVLFGPLVDAATNSAANSTSIISFVGFGGNWEFDHATLAM